MRVNLLGEQTTIQKVNFVRLFTVIIALAIVLGLGTHFFYLRLQLNNLQINIDNTERELQMLQEKKQQYFELDQTVAELERKYQRLSINRYTWAKAVEEQEYLVTSRIMLSSINISGDDININGRADNNDHVIEYVENLIKSPYYTNISLNSVSGQDDSSFNINAQIARDVITSVE